MTTCARCKLELGRKRWWINGLEYHDHCVRSEADWKEIDRLAELLLLELMKKPNDKHASLTSTAYNMAEEMFAERKRRRET